MAEVNFVALVFWVGRGLAVIHLGRTSSLEHARRIKCERALELTGLRSYSQVFLYASFCIERCVLILEDVKSVQLTYLTSVAVYVVLLAEILTDEQQVVHMIRTKHEATVARTKPVRGKGQRNGEYHGSEQKTRESTDVGGETDTADGQFPTASSRSRIHGATGTGKSESETESTDGESTGIIDNRSQLRQLGTGSSKLLKDHQHAEISFENSEKVE